MKAWNGMVAYGFPEVAMSYFASARTPEEFAALAWHLEEGTRRFYEGIAANLEEVETARLFRGLASDEENHKGMLKTLYLKRTGKQNDSDFPALMSLEEPGEQLTEAGVRVQEALSWVKGKPVKEVLELVMSLEVNAYDRYLAMEREVKDGPSEEVFKALSGAERGHIRQVSAAFERML